MPFFGGSSSGGGAAWSDGSGAPDGGSGNNGDYYLDNDTGDVYAKSSGSWSVTGNIKGEDGAMGSGEPGEPGLSAYEIAVEEGFVGTEAEWLASLVGAAGNDGADGAEGPEGPGPLTGAHIDGDNLVLETAGGNINAGNVRGPTGADGAEGEEGPQGEQGEIGETGAQGDQGPQGEAGPTVNWRGVWDAGTGYNTFDAVTQNGSSYLALSGNSNSSPESNPGTWVLMAQKGDAGSNGADGADGEDGEIPEAPINGTAYVRKDGQWEAEAPGDGNDGMDLRVGDDAEEKFGLSNGERLQIVAGSGISLAWDAGNKRVTISLS